MQNISLKKPARTKKNVKRGSRMTYRHS